MVHTEFRGCHLRVSGGSGNPGPRPRRMNMLNKLLSTVRRYEKLKESNIGAGHGEKQSISNEKPGETFSWASAVIFSVQEKIRNHSIKSFCSYEAELFEAEHSKVVHVRRTNLKVIPCRCGVTVTTYE